MMAAYSVLRTKFVFILVGFLLLLVGFNSLTSPVKAAACPAPATDMGSVTLTASVSQNVTYRIWSRIMTGTATTDNSYSLEVDGVNCYVVGDNNAITAGTWTWVDYQNGTTTSKIDLSLSSGSHTIKLIGREDGVQVDRVIITSDTTCVPSGTGDNCGGAVVITDTTAPTVSVSAPSAGATVSNNVTLTATASDNIGVAGVQFKVDGANVGAEDTTSPYSITWDSNSVANGSHNITAVARDAAGNTTTSAAVSITVSNTVVPPSSSPLAMYNFDENTGTTAADSSGNNNNATLSAATWAAAKYNSGLSFNGTTGYASAPDSVTLDLGANGTVEAWVKLTTLNKWHGVIAKGNDNVDDNHNYAIEIDNTNHVRCILGSGAANMVAVSTTSLVANTFYHLACSWDGTNLKTYINGTLDVSAPQTLTPAANTSALFLGQFGGSNDFMSGVVDDVRIYNISLTAAQIAADSSTPVGGSGTDTTAPTVSVTAPANNANVRGASVSITATASDNVGVAGVQFQLDCPGGSCGLLGAEDTTAPYSFTWNTTTLSDGPHTLTAVARDAAGNTTTSSTVTVNVDNTNPTGSVTAPAGSAVVKGTINVTSDSADATSGVANAAFQRSPAGAGTWTTISTDTTAPYAASWNTTSLTDGLYDLRVVTTDNAGNTFTSATVANVRVDNTGPTSSVTAPAASSNLRGSSVTVTATSTDGGSGVANVQFKLDGANLGSADTSSPYSITWDTTTATNGSHTITAVATDGAGNTTTSSGVAVTVDNAAPTVSVSAPAASANVKGTTVNITATAADTGGSGVANVQFKVDGVNVGSADTTSPYSATWDSTAATEGNHTITAVATDNAGNTTTSGSVTVNVDNTAPTTSITAPAASANLRGAGVSLTANASDTGSNVASVQFKVDGTNVGSADTTSPYSVTWDTTTATNGSHTITAVATDGAGNTTTSSGVVVTVDNAVPTVSVTAPTASANIRGSSVSLTATASDTGGSNLTSVQFKVDGTNVGSADTTSPYSMTWDTTTAADGAHTVTAVATDGAGNVTTSAAITVTVDNTNPTGSVTAPAGSAVVKGTINVTSDSADATSGVANAAFQRSPAGAGTWTTISTDTTAPYAASWNTTSLTDGLYDLRVVTTDNAGNTFTSATVANVRVDNTGPTTSVTAPTASSNLRGASVTVSANASDGGSGVANVQFKLDGANLGSADTSSPYSITWDTTTATNGSHTITAVATDTAGNTTTSSGVAVTVDNAAPSVTISTPANGATVTGASVSLTATASDNVGVAGVQFQLDCPGGSCGLLGAEDTTAPYSFTWNTTTLSDGPHTLTAVARDAAGNTTTSSTVTVNVDNSTPPDTTAPSVPNGVHSTATTTSSITMAWNASTDNAGGTGVAGYNVYRDGTYLTTVSSSSGLSYADTGLSPSTSYSYQVEAVDNSGNTSAKSTPATSVSTAALPPTVNLTATPNTITAGSSSDLSWNSTGATTCTASGAWSGSKLTTDSLTVTPASTSTYSLSCSGAGGSANASTTVTVNPAPSPPPPPPPAPPPAPAPAPSVKGDCNGDGHVTLIDLSILLSHYNQSYSQADFDSNGTVSLIDLSILLSNYGK